MDIGIVSIRYAKALLQFAMENHEEDGVYREMSAMADVFMKLPALQKAMQNPVLTSQQTETLLGSACGSGDSQTASTRKFIKLVVSQKRADFMMFIAHAYVTLYRKEKHLVKGRLVVAKSVSEHVAQRLQAIVEARTDSKVDFEVLVDENIGGGFILEYDTYRLDASVKTQIEKLHRALNA